MINAIPSTHFCSRFTSKSFCKNSRILSFSKSHLWVGLLLTKRSLSNIVIFMNFFGSCARHNFLIFYLFTSLCFFTSSTFLVLLYFSLIFLSICLYVCFFVFLCTLASVACFFNRCFYTSFLYFLKPVNTFGVNYLRLNHLR